MPKPKIYIFGVGNNTPVYIDLVENCGYIVAGLYHYNNSMTGDINHGIKILGSFEDFFSRKDVSSLNIALSQGDNAIRRQCFIRASKAGVNIPTLVHPTARVSRFVELGRGDVIDQNVSVLADVKIGDNSVISSDSTVMHTTNIGNHCFAAPCSKIGAYCTIEDEVFVGIGSIIISAKVPLIGHNAYIGAGALVTKSVPPNAIIAGCPAKIINYTNKK